MPKARKSYNINNFMGAVSTNFQGDGTTGGFQVTLEVGSVAATASLFATDYITTTPADCVSGSSSLV